MVVVTVDQAKDAAFNNRELKQKDDDYKRKPPRTGVLYKHKQNVWF